MKEDRYFYDRDLGKVYPESDVDIVQTIKNTVDDSIIEVIADDGRSSHRSLAAKYEIPSIQVAVIRDIFRKREEIE